MNVYAILNLFNEFNRFYVTSIGSYVFHTPYSLPVLSYIRGIKYILMYKIVLCNTAILTRVDIKLSHTF